MAIIKVTLTPSTPSLNVDFKEGDSVLALCDSTDSDFTVTLPDAKSNRQTDFYINKTVDANEVTLVPQVPGQKIQNEDTQVLFVDGDSPHLISDGENWWIV